MLASHAFLAVDKSAMTQSAFDPGVTPFLTMRCGASSSCPPAKQNPSPSLVHPAHGQEENLELDASTDTDAMLKYECPTAHRHGQARRPVAPAGPLLYRVRWPRVSGLAAPSGAAGPTWHLPSEQPGK